MELLGRLKTFRECINSSSSLSPNSLMFAEYVELVGEIMACGQGNSQCISFLIDSLLRCHQASTTSKNSTIKQDACGKEHDDACGKEEDGAVVGVPVKAFLKCHYIGTDASDELLLVKLINAIRIVNKHDTDPSVLKFVMKLVESKSVKDHPTSSFVSGSGGVRMTAECFLQELAADIRLLPVILKKCDADVEGGDDQSSSSPLIPILLRSMAIHAPLLCHDASNQENSVVIEGMLRTGLRHFTGRNGAASAAAVSLLLSIFCSLREVWGSPWAPHFEWFVRVTRENLLNSPSPNQQSTAASSTSSGSDGKIVLALESISQLSLALKDFLPRFFLHYDCNAEYGFGGTAALLDALLAFVSFTRDARKRDIALACKSSQVLCNLLDGISSSFPISKQQSSASPPSFSALSAGYVSHEELLRHKTQLAEVSKKWLESPKSALSLARHYNLLPMAGGNVATEELDDNAVAAFLQSHSSVLDKRVLGEYLVKHPRCLSAFLEHYNFPRGTLIDEAVREVLEAFRLPGESQQIDRVMETFARVYYRSQTHQSAEKSQGKGEEGECVFASQDAAFILAYSIIMLNTDQHNPQIKHRMTCEQFLKNNRGCNDGRDFPPEYLRGVFERIKGKAIVLPSEHASSGNFECAWSELRLKHASFSSNKASNAHDNGHVVNDLSLAVEGVKAPLLEEFARKAVEVLTPSLVHQNQRFMTDVQLEAVLCIASALIRALRRTSSSMADKKQSLGVISPPLNSSSHDYDSSHHNIGGVNCLQSVVGALLTASGYQTFFAAKTGNALPKYLGRVASLQRTLTCILQALSYPLDPKEERKREEEEKRDDSALPFIVPTAFYDLLAALVESRLIEVSEVLPSSSSSATTKPSSRSNDDAEEGAKEGIPALEYSPALSSITASSSNDQVSAAGSGPFSWFRSTAAASSPPPPPPAHHQTDTNNSVIVEAETAIPLAKAFVHQNLLPSILRVLHHSTSNDDDDDNNAISRGSCGFVGGDGACPQVLTRFTVELAYWQAMRSLIQKNIPKNISINGLAQSDGGDGLERAEECFPGLLLHLTSPSAATDGLAANALAKKSQGLVEVALVAMVKIGVKAGLSSSLALALERVCAQPSSVFRHVAEAVAESLLLGAPYHPYCPETDTQRYAQLSFNNSLTALLCFFTLCLLPCFAHCFSCVDGGMERCCGWR